MSELCPRCGAADTRIEERPEQDGVTLTMDYCGRCGENWTPKSAQLTAKELTQKVERIAQAQQKRDNVLGFSRFGR